MRQIDLTYVDCHTPDECVRALAEWDGRALPVAGGTDLYVLIKSGIRSPRALINVTGIDELAGVRLEGDSISIGAACTHSAMVASPELEDITCLVQAAGTIGSPQVRNAGTVGGNIANASPAGDTYPALMVLGAQAALRGPGGTRTLKLEDIPTGPGATRLRPDELLTRIAFERPPAGCYSGFIKIGLRNALAISVASAAILATARGGKLDRVRIACGAVAPRPIRITDVEKMLAGEEPTPELIAEAGQAVCRSCDPVTDIRANKQYRRHVLGVIVTRLVENACAHLTGYGKREDCDRPTGS